MYNLNYAPTTLGYKVEWKSVSRGTGGKKVEYHWDRRLGGPQSRSGRGGEEILKWMLNK
jgi:hypothetical protein